MLLRESELPCILSHVVEPAWWAAGVKLGISPSHFDFVSHVYFRIILQTSKQQTTLFGLDNAIRRYKRQRLYNVS